MAGLISNEEVWSVLRVWCGCVRQICEGVQWEDHVGRGFYCSKGPVCVLGQLLLKSCPNIGISL